MIRRIATFWVLLMFMIQPFYGQKFEAGITSGLSIATQSEPGDLYDNADLRTGFGGGLALRYHLSEAFRIQSGLIYEQKGFRNKENIGTTHLKCSGDYNYLSIPVMMEGSFPVNETVRFYGLTGGYVGFKTFSENSLVEETAEVSVSFTEDPVRHEDFGWIIGLGFEFAAGEHTVQAGVKYSLGLTEITSDRSAERNKSLLTGITFFF